MLISAYCSHGSAFGLDQQTSGSLAAKLFTVFKSELLVPFGAEHEGYSAIFLLHRAGGNAKFVDNYLHSERIMCCKYKNINSVALKGVLFQHPRAAILNQ